MYLYILCVLLCSIETIIVSLCANKDIINTCKFDVCLFNPIRSGLFQTVNDPRGRGGGALKAPPPPYDLENYVVNLHHIINVNFTRCFWHDFDHFTALSK